MLRRDGSGCRRGQHLAAHALDVLQGELVGVAADLVQLLLAAVLLGAAADKAPDAPALRQLPLARLQLVGCTSSCCPQSTPQLIRVLAQHSMQL